MMNTPYLHRSHKRGRGITLVEVLAAVILLAIAMPMLLQALGESSTQQVDYVLASRACWLTSEKMEDILADRQSTARGYDYLQSNNYPVETSIEDFPGFRREVGFVETGPSLSAAGTGYMKVSVTVKWIDVGGEEQSVVLSSAVTDYN